MIMDVTFPGGVKVDAGFHGFTVHTDQPEDHGGDNTAPSPFEFFLASIGTCAGFYVLRFCQQRGLATDGLGLTLESIRDPETKRVATIRLAIRLPEGFPEKYHEALIRTADQCAVKRAILEAPSFEVVATSPVVAN